MSDARQDVDQHGNALLEWNAGTFVSLVECDPTLSHWLMPYVSLAKRGEQLWYMVIVAGSVAMLCRRSREQKRVWVRARLRGLDVPEEYPWRWIRCLSSQENAVLTLRVLQACRTLEVTLQDMLQRCETSDAMKRCLHLRADIDVVHWALQESSYGCVLLKSCLDRLDRLGRELVDRHQEPLSLWGRDHRLLRLYETGRLSWCVSLDG